MRLYLFQGVFMEKYDIVVIGAGVVGAMISRELSRYSVKVCTLEAENDVCMGASKANSAIVHAGFDAKPGTLKAKFNVEGSLMMEEICRELGVKYKRNGSMVAAYTEDERPNLEELLERGRKNGVEGLYIAEHDEVLELEPNITPDVICALVAPTGAIVCPYELTMAAMGNAMDNGASLKLNFRVSSIERKPRAQYYEITSDKGHKVGAKYIINCAGVFSDYIAKLVGDNSFTITPRRGEYILLDKTSGRLFSHTLFKTPTKMGKGILISPTVDGNLILGPTSENIEDKEDKSVTANGLNKIKELVNHYTSAVKTSDMITTFCGLRAVGSTGDFIINSPVRHYINVAAIESPGLTSSPAIAKYVCKMLQNDGILSSVNECFSPFRRPLNWFKELDTDQKNEVIKAHPEFGRIICRCETVSEGEILYAMEQNPKPTDLDGVKRRTRAQMGRCQGGFCSPYILRIISEKLGINPGSVTKRGGDSRILPDNDGVLSKTYIPEEKPVPESLDYNVVIIGGGPAGLSAAISAYEAGERSILLLERENKLGGILKQCIHAGFGLNLFGEELTGPEFASRLIKKVKEYGIECRLSSTVLEISPEKRVTVQSENAGISTINAKTVILAMGCRERPNGALGTAGTRPSGIYTAGTAQRYINIEGVMPGHEVVILGSGDIGLIMARRMTLEGAKVKAVCEIQPYSGGLARNIEQCLNDFGIPLLLRHTVTEIHGRDRIEGVTITDLNTGEKQYISCDTLLLSVGLIPENELTKTAGINLSGVTKGAFVNQNRETEIPGIFACGNVLHVHDLADYASKEAEIAGRSAAAFVRGELKRTTHFTLRTDGKVRYTVPQTVERAEDTEVFFRVSDNFEGARLTVSAGDTVLLSKKYIKLAPGLMESVKISGEKLQNVPENSEITFTLTTEG